MYFSNKCYSSSENVVFSSIFLSSSVAIQRITAAVAIQQMQLYSLMTSKVGHIILRPTIVIKLFKMYNVTDNLKRKMLQCLLEYPRGLLPTKFKFPT